MARSVKPPRWQKGSHEYEFALPASVTGSGKKEKVRLGFHWEVRLIFERSPEALDEDIVHAAAPAVHGDRDLRAAERTGEVEAGELASLIRVEYPRRAVSGQRRGQGLDAEPGIHAVRKPPGQNVARRPPEPVEGP